MFIKNNNNNTTTLRYITELSTPEMGINQNFIKSYRYQ